MTDLLTILGLSAGKGLAQPPFPSMLRRHQAMADLVDHAAMAEAVEGEGGVQRPTRLVRPALEAGLREISGGN